LWIGVRRVKTPAAAAREDEATEGNGRRRQPPGYLGAVSADKTQRSRAAGYFAVKFAGEPGCPYENEVKSAALNHLRAANYLQICTHPHHRYRMENPG
jgi:hypothetical protein